MQNKITIQNKYCLTITEAASYFGIGEKKLRQLIGEQRTADWLLMNGTKALIKRVLFEKFIDETYSI